MSEPVTTSQLRAATEAYHRSVGDADEGLIPRSALDERYLELLRLTGRASLPTPPPPEGHWSDLFLALQRWFTVAKAQLAGMSERTEPDAAGMSICRVGEVWHLRYLSEEADFPVCGNKFLGWLAKLLAKPDYAWTIADLLGDPEGKLKADALLGGERAKDKDSLRTIWERIQEIDDTIGDAGGSEELESEKAKLLRQVEGHSSKERMTAAVAKAYKNITTQKRKFLQKLKKKMPQLSAHLKASLVPSGKDLTLSYRPAAGTARWRVEIPK
jgi:hypothetical protein